ncbi:hypothetical protein IW261DRAFT_652094 [Armillaria novae-zelandiae]|uniref:F-box domain-containing protein n=1 Tax=Armillaria novae-zelandiae TaxID=153914 RepID=A0AA39PP14_9AGAR|nr:hypothetical protein IW261DRAFT_652094 [Armillaria novae-zelandiae]
MTRRGEDITVDRRSIPPPIHRLPPEILSEIFMLLPLSCTEWYEVFDMSRPPWSLGHVCSSWRLTVVSSCRSIWSNPWIPLSSANGDIKRCDPISLLQTALERSGNYELSFSFSYDVTDGTRLHDATTLFQLLLDNSCRWRRIELSIEPQCIWSRLDSICDRLPSLTDLTIFCNDGTAVVRAFENAPRLRYVNICGFSAHSNIQLPLAFSRIVSYVDDRRLSSELIPYFLHIIKTSPHLHTFSSIVKKYDADIAEEHIQSSSLRILSACDGGFLQNLQLPSLEVMHVDPGPYEPCPRQTLPGLRRLLINSRCSLIELTITDAHPDENIIFILELAPLLRILKFMFSGWADVGEETFQAICARKELVPSLQMFSIWIRTQRKQLNFIDRSFVRMVCDRWSSGLLSAEVTSTSRYPLLPDDIKALRMCKEQGLSISVTGDSMHGLMMEYV